MEDKNYRRQEGKIQYHLIEIYLPFYYLLSQYSNILFLGAGTIGLLIVAFISCVNNGHKITWYDNYKYFTLFTVYVVLRQFITIFFGYNDITTVFHNIINIAISTILVFIVCDVDFDEEILYKSWKIAGVIFSAGMLYHVVLIYVMGRTVSPIIFMPGMQRASIMSIRPLSFFQEPAAFCTAILPLEFLALRRKNYFTAAWVTLFVLVSTSSVGVVLSAVLWGYYILTGTKLSLVRRVWLVVVIGIVLFLFFNLPYFSETILKLQSVSMGGSTWNSRVVGGFEVLASMDFLQWIFGSNMWSDLYIGSNLSRFTTGSVVKYYYAVDGNVFMNTFAQYIYNFGIIGFGIFLKMIFTFFKKPNYGARGFIIMFLVAIFGQTYAVGGSAFYMVIILLLLYSGTQTFDKDDYSID